MTDMLPGENAAPLEGVDAARCQAAQTQILAVASAAADGTLHDETLAGGLAAVAQVPLDITKVVNAVHVPEDAGEHAAGLEQILRRIPDGWGRWIGCGAGWYPLIVELDERIAELLPEYEIHQVKEKYGKLRFYWGMPELELACCRLRQVEDPRPEQASGPFVPAGCVPEAEGALEAWRAREVAHLGSAEHAEQEEVWRAGPERSRLVAAAVEVQALIAAAEERSARVCESCGADGTTLGRGGWLRTLCDDCGDRLGYARLPGQH